MSNPCIIAIVGSTASGKTALGIELAKRFGGEVICVDSRTVYRGMDTGTAKPKGQWEQMGQGNRWDIKSLSPGEKALMVEGVAHWGIDLVDPDEEFNVSQFKQYAETKIQEIYDREKMALLVGGTGLWMDAIMFNLEIPEVAPDPELRSELEAKSLEELFAEYEKLDALGALVIDRFNLRRLVRAIEVCRATGRPFSELRRKGESRYDCLWLGVNVPREELNRRINARVDAMIAEGLVDEVRGLKKRYGCHAVAMTGIGYRQLCRFLEGHQSLSDAVLDIKSDTRAYAKRQMTWFKRNQHILWITNAADATMEVEKFLRAV